MSRALSVDLRVRVLAAVAYGLTHREAAERFGASAASVSRWRKRGREQGDPKPRRWGATAARVGLRRIVRRSSPCSRRRWTSRSKNCGRRCSV
jgi:transposase